jgi:hypothetical protein
VEVAATVLSEAISLVTHLQSNMDSIEGAQTPNVVYSNCIALVNAALPLGTFNLIYLRRFKSSASNTVQGNLRALITVP